MRHKDNLEWVIIESQWCHISEFKNTPIHKRPKGKCPACNEYVIMKFGNVRKPHVAHYPNSSCIINRGESAIHFNMKYEIAKLLKTTNKIAFPIDCHGPPLQPECDHQNVALHIIDGWNRVKVEKTIDDFRIDIVLMRDAHFLVAIEVVVSNPLKEQKREYLESTFDYIFVFTEDKLDINESTLTLPHPINIKNGFQYTCSECYSEYLKEEKKIESWILENNNKVSLP